MSGYPPKPSKRFKKSEPLTTARWPKHAYLKFSTSSTASGVTLWEKNAMPFRENWPCRSRASVASSLRNSASTRMLLREKFLDWRKRCSLWMLRFTTQRGKHMWRHRSRRRKKIGTRIGHSHRISSRWLWLSRIRRKRWITRHSLWGKGLMIWREKEMLVVRHTTKAKELPKPWVSTKTRTLPTRATSPQK